ncbi:hypothetical protein [Psychromonas sp. SP041]|uniref:hypothetical protein n=1 Tax=Psychromonas sp. SP041 TaxID=1365007 RepID=UPI0010C7B5FB|nr:hypothetical protein [Psychromonas sp. SP041]
MLINSNCIDEICSAAFFTDDTDESLFITKMQMKLDEDSRVHTFTDKSYDFDELRDGLLSIINIHMDNYPEDESEMDQWKEALDDASPVCDLHISLTRGSN